MSELGVSFTIGAALAASVEAVTGSTVKHLDRLGKSAADSEAALGEVAGYRAARKSIDETSAALDDARRRYGSAGDASRRLTAGLRRQEGVLRQHERALEDAGVDVRRLDDEERRLTETLRQQRQQRAALDDAMQASTAAGDRRRALRGDLVEAGAVGYAVLRPLQAVVGKAIEFEEKMADVGKVVDFPAPGGLKEMGRDVLALSTRIPVAAADIADIVAAAGAAGISKGDTAGLLRFAEDAAKVAVAFDLTGEQAGSAMTGLRKIFQIGQDDAMDLAGAFNHLSNNMAVTAPDLLEITRMAGSMGGMLGLSGRQLAALGTTMVEMQTPANEAGTALNAMFTVLASIGTAEKKAQSALESIGLSADGLSRAMGEDAETAIFGFLDAVATLEGSKRTAVLSAIIGRDQAPKIAKLVEGADQLAAARKLAVSAEASAASVEREYAVRAATTAMQLQVLSGQMERLAINLGGALLPGINAVLGPIGAVADFAALLAERFPMVTTTVVGLTVGLVAGKVALVAYRYAAASVGETLASMRLRSILLRPHLAALRSTLRGTVYTMARVPAAGAAAAGGVGKVTKSLRILRLALVSTGIGAIVVGIGLAVAWLIGHWEGVKAFFGGFASAVAPALDALGPLGAALRWVGDMLGAVFGWIGSLFEPM